jgi:hypothetical protein
VGSSRACVLDMATDAGGHQKQGKIVLLVCCTGLRTMQSYCSNRRKRDAACTGEARSKRASILNIACVLLGRYIESPLAKEETPALCLPCK